MSGKSAKTKKLSVPRDMQAIQSEYQTLCYNAGQAQYQVLIHSKELARINDRIAQVNNEAAARLQLNKQNEKQTEETMGAVSGN